MFHSSLIKNTKTLYNGLKETIHYIDFKYGGLNEAIEASDTHSVSAMYANDGQAFANAYKMWLLSKNYDYVRKPDIPGLYFMVIHYPCTKESEQQIQNEISRISAQYYPRMTIDTIQVTEYPSERRCEIYIKAIDTITGLMTEATQGFDIPEANNA